MRDRGGRPLLITGSTGTLGQAFQRLCDIRGVPYHALTRRDVDVTDAEAVHAAVAALRPWAVVHCAGWVRVDERRARARGTCTARTRSHLALWPRGGGPRALANGWSRSRPTWCSTPLGRRASAPLPSDVSA
jgi:hypothetical protein